MSDSVQPHRRQPTRLLRPWDSPGKNTRVGCHFFLQCMKVKVKSLSRVRLFETPWTADPTSLKVRHAGMHKSMNEHQQMLMLIKTDKTTHICGWDLFPTPIKGARNKPWVYSSNSCPASPLLQGRASPKLCHVSTEWRKDADPCCGDSWSSRREATTKCPSLTQPFQGPEDFIPESQECWHLKPIPRR